MRVLITEYFHFSVDERRKEVIGCIKNNIDSGLFDKVIVLSEKDECPCVETILTGERLSYKYTFEYANKHLKNNDQVFVANSDILFDKTIKKVTLDDKTALTLTRWELNPERLHENMVASQDVWGFQVPIRVPPKSNFYFGIYGCDNYIAALLENEGYTLWNPCLSIKTYHIHSSEVRTYEVKPMKPFYNYAFPDPSTIEEEFPASFCTISNQKHELLAMLLSLRKHHPSEPIYIVSDSETKRYIETCAPFLKNLHISKTLDKHDVNKYNVMKSALMFSSDTLYLESSSILLDNIRVDKTKELGIDKTKNFVWTKNKNVNDSLTNMNYFIFDETYNVGWWRMNNPQEFAKYFWIQGPTYKGKRLKCVNIDVNDHKQFNQIVIEFLVRSYRWFEVMLIERTMNRSWVIMIPETSDDYFRELVTLEDFKIIKTPNIDFPRLGQFICLCDKENAKDDEKDFQNSLKVFINKSEYDDVKMCPWVRNNSNWFLDFLQTQVTSRQ